VLFAWRSGHDTVTAFRWFTPDAVFRSSTAGRTAHVDVGAAAARSSWPSAILRLTVLESSRSGWSRPVSSTPLRLRMRGGPDKYVFNWLYTKGHVRADRWYKLSRTILYGSLEDEHP
jgi:hypothetical protein